MDVLTRICNDKQEHIEKKKYETPLKDIKSMSYDIDLKSNFISNIRTKSKTDLALIAEIKKASPSGGVIRPDFNPEIISKAYEDAGASCLSVLTDAPYFQGDDAYIQIVKNSCSLPVLRKDFMLDPYQIYESKVLGADCVLLIVAALTDMQYEDLYGTAKECGLDVLTEIHNLEELERALRAESEMIGVNNRNLKTLDVNIETSLDLYSHIPDTVLAISESGLYAHDDLVKLQAIGYKGFLVGESLIKQDDIKIATQKLLGKT